MYVFLMAGLSVARAQRLAILQTYQQRQKYYLEQHQSHRGHGGRKIFLSDGFHHWAGFVVMGAKTRARPIPAGLSWSLCSRLKGELKNVDAQTLLLKNCCSNVVAQCLLDSCHRDTEDTDRDSVLASFLEVQVSESASAENEEEGILLPAEIVLAAFLISLQRSSQTLKHASTMLRGNREAVLAAVEQAGGLLEYPSAALKGDKDVVMITVKRAGKALRFANEELRGDYAVVTAAVENGGEALEYASEGMRHDQFVGLAAIINTATAIQFVTCDELRKIELLAVVRNARGDRVRKHQIVLASGSKTMRGEKGIVLYIVQKAGTALKFASDELRGDKQVVMVAVGENENALQYASKELRGDRKVVLAAVVQNVRAFQYVSEVLFHDKEAMNAIVVQMCQDVRGRGKLLSFANCSGLKDLPLLPTSMGDLIQ